MKKAVNPKTNCFVCMDMELLKLWYKFHTPKIIILKKSIKKWTIIANNNEDFI